jgi:hypothetical protein
MAKVESGYTKAMPSSSRLTIQASTIAQIQLMNEPVKQEKRVMQSCITAFFT